MIARVVESNRSPVCAPSLVTRRQKYSLRGRHRPAATSSARDAAAMPMAPVALDSGPGPVREGPADDNMTQKERMMAGKCWRYYRSIKDPQLAKERADCRTIVRQFNETSAEEEPERRFTLMEQILQQKLDPENPPLVEPPFACDYGYNIKFGKGVYINFNCCFLDCNTIEIGDDCLFGPYVQIYPPGHPLDAQVRDGLRGPEFAYPVKIGRGCWIGGHVIIQGGVTIGEGCTIGAGAVVTKDIPAFSVAVGNPAKVVREVKPGYVNPKDRP